MLDTGTSTTHCYARYNELDSTENLQYCTFGTCVIDLWVAASEVWLFFLYDSRKAGTEQFQTWQAEWFIRESRSEPAQTLGLAVVVSLGNAGFEESRTKFCNPCFVRCHKNSKITLVSGYSSRITLHTPCRDIVKGRNTGEVSCGKYQEDFIHSNSKFLSSYLTNRLTGWLTD